MSSTGFYYNQWYVKGAQPLPLFIREIVNYGISFKYDSSIINSVFSWRVYVPNKMYYKKSEWDNYQKEVIDKYIKDNDFFDMFYNKNTDFSLELIKNADNICKTNWSKEGSSSQKIRLLEFFEKTILLFNITQPHFYLEDYIGENLKSKIKNHLANNRIILTESFDETFAVITDLEEETFDIKERKNLINLAIKFSKICAAENKDLSDVLKKDIEDHIQEYGWLGTFIGIQGEAMNVEYVTARIKDLIKLDLQHELELNSVTCRREISRNLIKELKIPEEFMVQVNQIKKLNYLRTWRIEVLSYCLYQVKDLCQTIAEGQNYKLDDFIYLTWQELKDYLQDNEKLPLVDKIQKRKKEYVLEVKNGATSVYTDQQKINLYKKQYQVEIVNKSELTGNIACKGYAEGSARLIYSPIDDLPKVKQGEIMVCMYSTPDFVPAMKKVSAIVTDQGGISSHAAIVSRELNIPCITGTKNATSLIKTGDRVIVDANKGIVRILDK